MLNEKEQWRLELEQYDFDVLVVGHTHQVFAEFLGQTLVINPGSTKFNNSCAILSLPDLEVRNFCYPVELFKEEGISATENKKHLKPQRSIEASSAHWGN